MELTKTAAAPKMTAGATADGLRGESGSALATEPYDTQESQIFDTAVGTPVEHAAEISGSPLRAVFGPDLRLIRSVFPC